MSLSMVGVSQSRIRIAKAHSHNDYEIIVNVEGSGIMTVGDKEYPFCEGDIYIVPKNVPHIKRSDDGFKDLFFRTDKLNPIAMAKTKEGRLFLCDDSERSFTSVVELMRRRFCMNIKNDAVLESMYELALRMLDDRFGRKSTDPAVDYIVNRIACEFNEPDISISDILSETGYSKDHMRRRFIEAMGITPAEYLTSIRISYAKKLLADNSENRLSLSTIGAMCGYFDSRYFSRIFKSNVGISPGDYSKRKK